MWEFLQSYGIWILFGVLFLFMMRAHGHGGHGGGCGMGGHERTKQPTDQHTVTKVEEKRDHDAGGGCH